MKKILILITTLLFLQGCSSNKSYTNDQLQNLTNSNLLEQSEYLWETGDILFSMRRRKVRDSGDYAIMSGRRKYGRTT